MDGQGERQGRNEGGEGGMYSIQGETCAQGLATPRDRAPVLLSPSFPVLLWVHLSNSLPVK